MKPSKNEENFELMMSITLPERPAGMGDEEWFHVRSAEIMSHKPPGTEVKWESGNRKWHTDAEGITYVPLYCRSDASVTKHWIEKCYESQDKLIKIKKFMRGALNGVYGE